MWHLVLKSFKTEHRFSKQRLVVWRLCLSCRMRSFWGLSLLVLIVPTAHGVDKSIGKTRTVRFGAFFSLVFCLFGFYVVVLGFFLSISKSLSVELLHKWTFRSKCYTYCETEPRLLWTRDIHNCCRSLGNRTVSFCLTTSDSDLFLARRIQS